MENNWLGASFDLTPEGIRLSVPTTFPRDLEFCVILKRFGTREAPEVSVRIRPIWRHYYNHSYDEIGGKIVSVEPQKEFKDFLAYSQEAGPSGLLTLEKSSSGSDA